MADDLLARQAATYGAPREAKPAAHLERARGSTAQPLPPSPRPMSQTERQAATYRVPPQANAAAFKRFTEQVGISEEQARKVVDWLVADER